MSGQLTVARTDTHHRTQRRFGAIVSSRQETGLSWLKALSVVTASTGTAPAGPGTTP